MCHFKINLIKYLKLIILLNNLNKKDLKIYIFQTN